MRRELHNEPIPEEEENDIEKEPTADELALTEKEFVEPFEANPLDLNHLDLQHDDDGLSQYKEDLKPFLPEKPLTRDEFEEMFRKGDHDGLFFGVVLMVIDQAIKRATETVSVMDLIQQGNEAIMKSAIPSFKPEKSKFSSWAMWWIRQAQKRYLKENFRSYKTSDKTISEAWRVQKENYSYMAKNQGEKPSNAKLAELAGLSSDVEGANKAGFLLKIAQTGISSFSAEIGDDDDTELGDIIEDTEAFYRDAIEDSIDDKKVFEFYSQEINKRLQPVGDKYDQGRLALRLRLGIDENGVWTGKFLTLQAVGDRLNLTRERIRQLQTSGLGAFRDNRTLFTILSNHLYPKIAKPISEQIAQGEMSRKQSKK